MHNNRVLTSLNHKKNVLFYAQIYVLIVCRTLQGSFLFFLICFQNFTILYYILWLFFYGYLCTNPSSCKNLKNLKLNQHQDLIKHIILSEDDLVNKIFAESDAG